MARLKPSKLYKRDNYWFAIKRIENLKLVVSVGAGRNQVEKIDAVFWSGKKTNTVKVLVYWDWFPSPNRSIPGK